MSASSDISATGVARLTMLHPDDLPNDPKLSGACVCRPSSVDTHTNVEVNNLH
jgi:hypothetical protein